MRFQPVTWIFLMLLLSIHFSAKAAQEISLEKDEVQKVDSLHLILEQEEGLPGKIDLMRTYLASHPSYPDSSRFAIGDSLEKVIYDSTTAVAVDNIYNFLGQYYRHKLNYSRSLEYYLVSQSIARKWGLNWREYVNLGHLYNQIQDTATAISYYVKALTYARDTFAHNHPRRQNSIAWPKLHIAKTIYLMYPDSALTLLHSALEEWKQVTMVNRERGAIPYGYYVLASIELKLNHAYERGLRYADTIDYWYQYENVIRHDASFLRATCYWNLNNIDSALFWANKCLDQLYSGDSYGYVNTNASIECLNLLANIHEYRGEYQIAYKCRSTADSILSTVDERQNFARITFHREQQRISQVEYQNQLILKKERNRNILLAYGGLFLLIVAGGLFSRLRYISRTKRIIEKEKDRSEHLLLNILPSEIAQELKEKGSAEARDFELVSILFTDFIQFTETSAKMNAGELVHEINHCFEAFDHIIEKYKVEKIKTIGDAYMAAGGLPVPTEESTSNTVLAALEMQEFIEVRYKTREANGEPSFQMRVGIHTGPVVAGIVGVKKFQYDVWGDTVNTAARIESHGEAGMVNISRVTYEHIKDDPDFIFESRGKMEVKGKGELSMWFVKLTEN